MTTACTGNVTGITDHRNVPTDSWKGRNVNVSITRCSACPGSALVDDPFTGDRWIIALPADYRHDDQAAYWAAEASLYATPLPRPEAPETPETPEPVTYEAEEDYYEVEDEDGSVAFARYLERQAEQGSWWGRDEF